MVLMTTVLSIVCECQLVLIKWTEARTLLITKYCLVITEKPGRMEEGGKQRECKRKVTKKDPQITEQMDKMKPLRVTDS